MEIKKKTEGTMSDNRERREKKIVVHMKTRSLTFLLYP